MMLFPISQTQTPKISQLSSNSMALTDGVRVRLIPNVKKVVNAEKIPRPEERESIDTLQVRKDESVGVKNITSSSGWAMTNKIRKGYAGC